LPDGTVIEVHVTPSLSDHAATVPEVAIATQIAKSELYLTVIQAAVEGNPKAYSVQVMPSVVVAHRLVLVQTAINTPLPYATEVQFPEVNVPPTLKLAPSSVEYVVAVPLETATIRPLPYAIDLQVAAAGEVVGTNHALDSADGPKGLTLIAFLVPPVPIATNHLLSVAIMSRNALSPGA
jgi:hypothetical protein